VSGSSELRPGGIVELSIEKPVYLGRGLARLDGRVVFVARSFPGDRLRGRITAVHAGWAEASVVELLEPAARRRPSPCPNGPGCGGCSYQEVEHAEQLRLKETVLRDALGRAGVPHDGEIGVRSAAESGWRMRAALHCAAPAGRLRIGYREEGSRRTADFVACQQLSAKMNDTVASVREALSARRDLAPALRGLELLESPDGSVLAAAIATALPANRAAAFASLAGQVPGLAFGVECQPRRLHWLQGDPHVRVPLLGLTLRAHVRSFFQSNRYLYEALAREVLDLVPAGQGRVIDLYSGAGLFALPLAAREGVEVVAVEHGGFSTEDARANGRANGLGVRVVESGVAAALAALPATPGERVVLDPPRTGAGPEVVDRIADRRPAVVVYVSCDPPTLGRDLARFSKRGYRAATIRLVDLFPNTYHLETVVQLVPA
jgi:23S rRNA (uracil1939-C5)-methyltransferase